MSTTSPAPDSSPPELRPYQYSIRSLLALTVLVALGVGFIPVLLRTCSPDTDVCRRRLMPVTGTVLVDGSPEPGLKLAARPGPPDEPNPTYAEGITNAKGHFELGIYDPGDGLPPGEYKLTLTWPDTAGNDRLHGRYAKAADSPKTFMVRERPIDLGTIPLTTRQP